MMECSCAARLGKYSDNGPCECKVSLREHNNFIKDMESKVTRMQIDKTALVNCRRKLIEANGSIVEFRDIKLGHRKRQRDLVQGLDHCVGVLKNILKADNCHSQILAQRGLDQLIEMNIKKLHSEVMLGK